MFTKRPNMVLSDTAPNHPSRPWMGDQLTKQENYLKEECPNVVLSADILLPVI